MNGQQLHFNSWAKINICLHLGRKRDDGYHELKSIMQLIDLHDELSFFSQETGITLEVKSTVSGVPAGEENIIYRAARDLMAYRHVAAGVHISVEKKIPAGGGLGGGSGNAFTTLKALNLLWDLELSPEEMHLLSSRMGSDVPFFTVGGTALVEGRGEVLTPLNDGKPFFLILVIPPFSIATVDAYRWWDEEESVDLLPSCEHLTQGSAMKILHNDFEGVLFKRFPLLGEIKDSLVQEGCEGALLSGSGSTIFGLAESRKKADMIAERLMKKNFGKILITQTRGKNEKG